MKEKKSMTCGYWRKKMVSSTFVDAIYDEPRLDCSTFLCFFNPSSLEVKKLYRIEKKKKNSEQKSNP